jgi:hypothetical protein
MANRASEENIRRNGVENVWPSMALNGGGESENGVMAK